MTSRFPLSCTQEMWCSLDDGDQAGAFGPRFISTTPLRITGQLDPEALQGALDDVVVRHEILRTIVVRDAEPPHQQLHPPRPVPLEVRELPSAATGQSRDVLAELLIMEVEQGILDVRRLPLLRAVLGRFDDRDWVLILVTHHTVADAWSMQLITRDLAAFYAARTDGRPAALPAVRQYREFAAWQQARVSGPSTGAELDYWREKLDRARIFALPADRPVPDRHTRPYSAHEFLIGADEMATASALARTMRSSAFMALLAAFNVLAHQINGTTDPVIDTLITGRNEPQFQDTVGPFLNFLPLRTDISDCTSFRDVLIRTRRTCLEAYSHEIPINNLTREIPELMQPARDPKNSDTILGLVQAPTGSATVQIADGTYEITERSLEPVNSDLPQGIAWTMEILPSGELSGRVQYNLDEFDERTVARWVSDYRRVLFAATTEPDREWKAL
jgi:hypothetical protein